ncbi:MAG: glutathione S-transferase C-terminal domain-containing protein [Myxococcota bacterium]|nr:glutathione S-transferase C-terminal domain-containing protein [Myxococcales bacterium]
MMRVYGSRISYYAGKLETYLRYRGIPYELLAMTPHAREIRAGAGVVQSPVVRLDDGRWMSDSTPTIAWLESQRAKASIYPEDAGLRFLALLLEDHADEWLWRPAMHYRWSHREDREHASGVLADEQLPFLNRPRFLKRLALVRRQRGGFVERDGVCAATVEHVERTTRTAFDLLEATFAVRPFVLGARPTIADFGFAGPMLRHFGQDPTPASLMRECAPRVYTWVARMWEAAPQPDDAPLVADVDAPLAALLREACETHLVQLRENARAFAAGASRFAQVVQGCRYEGLPVSRYRVWCLEELRRHWRALDAATQTRLRAHLPEPGGSVLWDDDPAAASGYDPEHAAPFNRAIHVFPGGVPR